MSAPFDQLGRLLRTVRHLRARQLTYQILRRLCPLSAPSAPKATWDGARAERVLAQLAAMGPVGGDAHAEAQARAWIDGTLGWLGVRVKWNGDWRMQGPSPLWRYHLHYHEHLADAAWLAHREANAEIARRVVNELRQWAGEWKSGGTPAWDGYPVAVRLVSWLRILAWSSELLDSRSVDFLRVGIATHVAHLRRSLEWHVDGNHLLRDTWALALGASVLEGAWAEKLKRHSIFLFESILAEQVLSDGWHEERSPMYHVRALRDALEVERCLAAAGTPLSPSANQKIDAMFDSLPWMLRADGTLWHLNDTADDHGVDVAGLLAVRPSITAEGTRAFAASRTVVLVDACGDRLRLDLGGPAPSHQPGHAHAGALGLEYDVSGVPFIVDGGCSGYDGDPWRAYFRGTSAHSTLTIDARDQSEMWATFRIGARAEVFNQRVSGDASEFVASAAVRPYHSRVAEHSREVSRRGRTLKVVDVVAGAAGRCVESFVHFSPEWEAVAAGEGRFELRHPLASASVKVEADADATLHRGEFNPTIGWRAVGFNRVVPSWTLRLRATCYTGRPWKLTFSPN